VWRRAREKESSVRVKGDDLARLDQNLEAMENNLEAESMEKHLEAQARGGNLVRLEESLERLEQHLVHYLHFDRATYRFVLYLLFSREILCVVLYLIVLLFYCRCSLIMEEVPQGVSGWCLHIESITKAQPPSNQHISLKIMIT
jgi:hypothetical protein